MSLHEAFEHGGEIRDLTLRPHERIALMRLLICITQAALDGPEDYDDGTVYQPHMGQSVLVHLDRWHHTLELFGDGQRFVQVANLQVAGEDDEGNSTSELDLALATGNNPMLFDHAGGSDRPFTPAELALMITTFQNFTPGGRIGVALWGGKDTPGKGSSEHAGGLWSPMAASCPPSWVIRRVRGVSLPGYAGLPKAHAGDQDSASVQIPSWSAHTRYRFPPL